LAESLRKHAVAYESFMESPLPMKTVVIKLVIMTKGKATAYELTCEETISREELKHHFKTVYQMLQGRGKYPTRFLS